MVKIWNFSWTSFMDVPHVCNMSLPIKKYQMLEMHVNFLNKPKRFGFRMSEKGPGIANELHTTYIMYNLCLLLLLLLSYFNLFFSIYLAHRIQFVSCMYHLCVLLIFTLCYINCFSDA